MGPDAAIFAEMAQDLLLGPSQTQPADPPAQPVPPAQLSQQDTQSMPQGYAVPDQSQSWQRPASTAPQPQHQQQVCIYPEGLHTRVFMLIETMLQSYAIVGDIATASGAHAGPQCTGSKSS